MLGRIITLTAALGCSGFASGQTLHLLPELAGTTQAGATCVSDDGRTVGGWSGGANASAVLWVDGVPRDLGRLPGRSSASLSAVSADGRVAAGSSSGRAFRWTAEGGMVQLASLTPGSTADWVWAMTADGTVIVGSSGGRSVMWRGNDAPSLVGFPNDGEYNSALGVSDDAAVVGGIFDQAQLVPPVAVRWTSQGGAQAFLSDRGGSVALGVSGDGHYILGSTGFAFRWSVDRGLEEFGEAGASGYALRSSFDGSVIVGRRHEMVDRGLVWTARTGVLDLQRWAEARGVAFAGLTVREVTAVSRDGRVLAGWAADAGGASHAWMMDAPCLACPADLTCDGVLDADDWAAFTAAFESGGPGADRNGDGFVDFFDDIAFLDELTAGC